MLFLIILTAVALILMVAAILVHLKDRYYDRLILIVSLAAVSIFLLMLCAFGWVKMAGLNYRPDARLAKLKLRREAIIYQYKAAPFWDKANRAEDIYSFNKEVQEAKIKNGNIWDGAYYPDYYLEVETISENELK